MGSLVYVILAVAAGWLAGRVPAGAPPYAIAGCAPAALIGAVVVSLPLGDRGLHLLGVAVIPAVAGALTGALAARLLLARLSAQRH